MRRFSDLVPLVAATAIAVVTSCADPFPSRPTAVRSVGDGLDPSSLPVAMREPYELFAQRCSKCHALSRALDNGHVGDEFWERYVDRMRRQPGSGISPEDVPPILRFLRFYTTRAAASSGARGGGAGGAP